MKIQHNMSAINTFRQMGINSDGTTKQLKRLSSGYRINSAGDDASGLAISEKMRSQVRGLNRASVNAEDGISLIQSAEGALHEVHSVLHRMRELGIQAANDVNETEDRHAMQGEIEQLQTEIDRVAYSTEFNKKTILDGSLTGNKYAKAISGGNVSSVALYNPAEAVNGLTTVAVKEAGEKFNMTFDFTPAIEPVPASTNLYIAVSKDIALASGIPEAINRPIQIGSQEDHPYLTVPVLQGDKGSDIAERVRDILSPVINNGYCSDAWNITASGGKLTIESNYVGRFGGCNDYTAGNEKIFGAFHVFAGSMKGGTVTPANKIFDPTEWDSGEPNAHMVGQSDPKTLNVYGNMGADMVVTVDGKAPSFANENFTQWFDNWTADGNTGPLTSANTGILRGKDTSFRLLLDDSYERQVSFRIDDPTVVSSAIIEIKDGNELILQVGANTTKDQTTGIDIKAISVLSLGISELNVCTNISAVSTVASVENAIQLVSAQRTSLGAVQNELEHVIANLDTVSENLQSAESRIRDADMAKEMLEFVKFDILAQSSQAMMAQSNSLPQGVLQLLR